MQKGRAWRAQSRHVFFVAGYHPMAVDGHFRVFTREMHRFASNWAFRTHVREEQPEQTITGALWHVEAEGPDWTTQTTFEVLAWDDLVRADMKRSVWSHVKGSVRALVDMLTSGTLRGYFGLSRRYALFFLLTYLVLFLIWMAAAGIGFAIGYWLAPHLGGMLATLLGGLGGVLCGLGLMRWPGRRLRLQQSLDLAEFSVDYAQERHPDVDARVRAFGQRLVDIERAGEIDEIVIAGHSLGAMHVVSAVAAALKIDPDFGRKIPVRLLTLGSTTVKFALNPAGVRLRAAADEVAAASWIGWLEVQSRDDIVSFYKVNPVTLSVAEIADTNTVPGDFSARPLIRHAAIADMLSAEAYHRFRLDIMRLHCQCFLASDKRACHDFNAYAYGPVLFEQLAAKTSGLMDFVTEDGALRPRRVSPEEEE